MREGPQKSLWTDTQSTTVLLYVFTSQSPSVPWIRFSKKHCSGKELFFFLQDNGVRATDLLIMETAGWSLVPGPERTEITSAAKSDEKKL